MKLTVACSYIVLCYGISSLRSHNLQVCGFCTVAELLTHFLVLKEGSCRK